MSYEQRLQERTADGLSQFHVTKGEGWNNLSREERSKALLDILDTDWTKEGTIMFGECPKCEVFIENIDTGVIHKCGEL
jgi:hypothetical protein